MKNYFILISVAIFSAALGAHLPSDFKTCKRSDPDFNECVRVAFEDAIQKLKNGNEHFKIPVLDPISIPELTIGEGTGPVQVVQKFKNAKLYGLSSLKLKNYKVTITDKECSIEGALQFDDLKLEADYDLDGHILVLPIKGNGTSTVTLEKMDADFKFVAEIFNKKGKDYADFKLFDADIRPKRVTFDFKNLFDGNKELGDGMNNVLNENWKEVFNDVKSGYKDAIGAIFIDIGNRIFKKVPLEEIFPQ